MKTNNMTFGEALEAMKQGYKIKRQTWGDRKIYYHIEGSEIKSCSGNSAVAINCTAIMATDWEIYDE